MVNLPVPEMRVCMFYASLCSRFRHVFSQPIHFANHHCISPALLDLGCAIANILFLLAVAYKILVALVLVVV